MKSVGFAVLEVVESGSPVVAINVGGVPELTYLTTFSAVSFMSGMVSFVIVILYYMVIKKLIKIKNKGLTLIISWCGFIDMGTDAERNIGFYRFC